MAIEQGHVPPISFEDDLICFHWLVNIGIQFISLIYNVQGPVSRAKNTKKHLGSLGKRGRTQSKLRQVGLLRAHTIKQGYRMD